MLTEDQMWNMSDEELEKMFLEAKSENPPADVENENDEDIEDITMEQPDDVDSDDNGTEIVELESGTDEPTDTDVADEITDVDDEVEPTEEPKDEEIVDVQEVQKFKFKANNKEYEFTEEEMKSQFPKVFGQAMDYTRKTQAMKPWRKTIDAIEQAKLGHDDINLMIDVLRGDKQAIAEVIKRTGVDALDLDTENSKYIPKDYGRDESALAIKDVIDEISGDREYDSTHKILTKDWDETSFREMTKDPELIKQLHIDVKSGMFSKVQPIAEKMKLYDGNKQSDLDYYKMAAVEHFKEQADIQRRAEALEQQKINQQAKADRQAEIARVKAAEQTRAKAVEKVEIRKAAAPIKSNAGTKKVVDYLNDSDEDFEDWYKDMESKR